MLGLFSQIKGIALGRFSRCLAAPSSDSQTVEEVLKERLGDFGIAVISDLPFGHDGDNAALPVGTMVELDGDRGILEFFYP
jgi:muramoyltetrapeptide carboxypeptidase